tara:strand:- start:100 stop:378 length:279 start_codon:yes stop_codon:yes gene_type:complete
MKKILVIVTLSLMFNTSVYATSKKEAINFCPEYFYSLMEQANTKVTKEKKKIIKESCKCLKEVFSTIPDDSWNSFDKEKKLDLFVQSALGCM